MKSGAIKGVRAVRPKLANGEQKTYYYRKATNCRLPDEPNEGAGRVRYREARIEDGGVKIPV